MNGRRIRHGSGKVLGGSSAVNDMLFQRGNPLDFERWAADPGMAGWDYAHCLPYFKRSETCTTGADTWRGGDGPLVLERGPAAGPLFRAFFEAVLQADHQLTNDVNGYRQEGFAAFDRNISRGRRLSAASAYLRPVARRPNLEVRCRTVVNRVLFEGVRAVGVEITHGDTTERVDAGEVILCAGAINSPHVLQLSGIGNAGELRAVGVDVIADLPAVGANLQDHLVVRVKHSSSQPVTAGPALRWRNRPSADMNWLLFRRGPGATNHLEAGGFARSNASVAYPNLMFHFVALALREGDAAPRGHGYQLRLGPTDSDARGSVKIVSADPCTHPAVRFNHLTSEQDRREWVEAVRAARRILRQAAFESFNAGELAPGAGVDTDEELAAWVARDAESARHPASTCRMGVGADSVVHPRPACAYTDSTGSASPTRRRCATSPTVTSLRPP